MKEILGPDENTDGRIEVRGTRHGNGNRNEVKGSRAKEQGARRNEIKDSGARSQG